MLHVLHVSAARQSCSTAAEFNDSSEEKQSRSDRRTDELYFQTGRVVNCAADRLSLNCISPIRLVMIVCVCVLISLMFL